GFSVNGQRVASSNFLLDGIDNNDLLVTGPATRVSADAVKEYRMNTNNYSAEFGRASGFIANAITRSGTNSLHGTAYEFFNNDRLNANSFANNLEGLPKLPFRQNQYGVSVGGPIRRDRMFFFGNFERFHSDSESQPQTFAFPGPAFISALREGTLAKRLFTEFAPPSGEPVPGTFDFAVSRKIVTPLIQRNTFWLGRVDYSSANGRHRLSGRYSLSDHTEDKFFFSPYPGLDSPLLSRGQNLVANYIRDIAGGSNELKFGLNRNTVSVFRPKPEFPTIQTEDFVFLPDEQPAGFLLPGSEALTDYAFRDTAFHLLDNYSRLNGKHSLGFGVEWRPIYHNSLLSVARDGRYIFSRLFDVLFDNPYWLDITVRRQDGRVAQESDYRRYYRHNEFAGFLQDNVKLTRRLTLNLGVRY
ncbi:MAG: hypothetical protein ACREUU_07055, partial [Gammaproteobacteria bacterium]